MRSNLLPGWHLGAGSLGGGGGSLGGSLTGLSWSLPFLAFVSAHVYTCAASVSTSAVMNGAAGVTYSVTLNFAGTVETKGYTGGTNDGAYWQVGGSPVSSAWNYYKLTISNPSQVFYLNKGTDGLFTLFGINYTKTISITAGATVTLFASSEGSQEIGEGPVGAGQFINMTVLSVV